MLNNRFVGVTAGLGTANTDNCTGNKNTAPDTPTGAVNTEINAPATNPISTVPQLTTQPRSASAPTRPRRPHVPAW